MTVGVALLAIFFSFIIGVVFGGMAAFLSRRLMFNRQIRIAERKAARIMGDTKEEAHYYNDPHQDKDRSKFVLKKAE